MIDSTIRNTVPFVLVLMRLHGTLYSETTSNAQRSTSNAELVAPSISRRLAAQLDFAGNDRGVYPTAAITFSSIAIGVGNAVTLIVVRVGFGLAGPAKYSA